jgi:predicted acyltransferase
MDEANLANPADKSPSSRLKSLDALRGFDMFWIKGGTDFFLNLAIWLTPALVPFFEVQFNHQVWNGFSFYDLIFPLFVFLSGISIPFSLSRRIEKGDKQSELLKHIFTRTFWLLVLGFIFNNANVIFTFDLNEFRWLGVLQRIAITFFAAALLEMYFKPKWQIIIGTMILVGYWLILLLVPVPGFGAYNLTQQGNLVFYVDSLLLPGKFCCFPNGDNEGILSTIPAIATAILGVNTGHWLRSSHTPYHRIAGLVIAGVLCLGLALAWNQIFPINKYLWSSTFVLYAGGWSLFLVALFYWLIDVLGWQRWAFFFIVIGMNALLIYMIGGLLDLQGLFGNISSPAWLIFLITAAEIAIRWIVLFILYRKKKFLKI